MVTVKVPNRYYNGVIGGVSFTNGSGEFADVALAERIAQDFGFEVVGKVEEAEPAEDKPKTRRPRKEKAGE